jgi:hypothetical protein
MYEKYPTSAFIFPVSFILSLSFMVLEVFTVLRISDIFYLSILLYLIHMKIYLYTTPNTGQLFITYT